MILRYWYWFNLFHILLLYNITSEPTRNIKNNRPKFAETDIIADDSLCGPDGNKWSEKPGTLPRTVLILILFKIYIKFQ